NKSLAFVSTSVLREALTEARFLAGRIFQGSLGAAIVIIPFDCPLTSVQVRPLPRPSLPLRCQLQASTATHSRPQPDASLCRPSPRHRRCPTLVRTAPSPASARRLARSPSCQSSGDSTRVCPARYGR